MHGLIFRVDVIFSFQNKPPNCNSVYDLFSVARPKTSHLFLSRSPREVASQNWLGGECPEKMGDFTFCDHVQTLCSTAAVTGTPSVIAPSSCASGCTYLRSFPSRGH